MGDLRVTSSNVAYQLVKILNLEYRCFLEKVFSKMTYHERRFMAFKPNEQWYGHIRWIVCDNMPKFGTCLHLVMANNVAKERFQLVSQKKPFFIFWMPKTRVFREAATKRDIPNGAIPCLPQSRPYFTDGHQKSCISDPRSYSRPFSRPIQMEPAEIWTAGAP